MHVTGMTKCRGPRGGFILRKPSTGWFNVPPAVPLSAVPVSLLRLQAPQSPWCDVEAVFQEEFGRGPLEVFTSFERVPIASASLAQVAPPPRGFGLPAWRDHLGR